MRMRRGKGGGKGGRKGGPEGGVTRRGMILWSYSRFALGVEF